MSSSPGYTSFSGKGTFLMTSESVGEGHPGKLIAFLIKKNTLFPHLFLDKICDQVSDAILDACLKEDPNSKVACGKQ